jgi:hypothetical protein
MWYYHILVQAVGEHGEPVNTAIFGYDEQTVKKIIVEPYMKNEDLMLASRVVPSSNVQFIDIFRSSKREGRTILLPNGTNARDSGISNFYYMLNCFRRGDVEDVGFCTNEFIPSAPKKYNAHSDVSRAATDLMTSASFLGLDTNWSSAVCALQLQEVGVKLVAKNKNIKLDKSNVEKILGRKCDNFSFNEQYEAFALEVKRLFDMDMPILTIHFRKMRTAVLHEGYNPKPEEKDSIASFTTGLLRKLNNIDKGSNTSTD